MTFHYVRRVLGDHRANLAQHLTKTATGNENDPPKWLLERRTEELSTAIGALSALESGSQDSGARLQQSVGKGPAPLMSRRDLVQLECRLLDGQRQLRVLLGENDVLRTFLREAVSLLHGGAPSEGVRALVDRLERFL
jgi:hypothetical protein